MPSIYDLASNYEIGGEPGIRLPIAAAPIAPAATAEAAQPVMTQMAAIPQVASGGRNDQLMSLVSRYFPQGDEYGAELKSARETMTRESEAFNKLLQDAIKQPGDTGPSKAEMYFRLAAAFGAPTKTGNFMESLGKAGEAAATMNKEQREAALAERNRRLQLGLEAQKLRMTGAKEDLNTLRALAAEGMKDKRTIATELIKDYVKSGQPESSAGKQAKDEGLQPGTPEFQKRVSEIAAMNTEQQMSRINATLAQMGTAQANLALAQQKFDFQQQQATKLTPQELKLKTETEDALNSVKGSMGVLSRAFELNKNSMSGSLADKAARTVLEAAGSKDPVLVNTQELENLLTDQMISSASEKMKGVLSDSDIKLLSMVSGAKSKNQEERRRIMLNAYGALQRGQAKLQKRFNEINQGLYRDTTPAGGLE
ncbi:MAG: hypothetical protein RL758_212 [Pseudomonadota bacterium]|jgi:hypothetical protein